MGLTSSRTISRKAPMKGVKAIGFAPFLASDPVVNTVTGVVTLPTVITTAPSVARIEVKATGNNIVDTGTFDEATRTNEYVAVNTFFIPGADQALRAQVQGYAGILQTIFIEDYNGNILVQGAKNGCDVMTLANGTDTQGWSFTIQSREADAMYVLTETAKEDYKDALLPNA
jgi:hypothetical protein